MKRKIIITILLSLSVSLSAQVKDYSLSYKPFAGLASLNRRPSTGFSAGNTLVISKEQKKLGFATTIRYTFVSEIQKEKSIPTYSFLLVNWDPKYNSLISAVDFSENIIILLFEKRKISLSGSAGINIRKWSETTNIYNETLHIIDDLYPYDVYTSKTEFVRIWQLGCNAAIIAGIKVSKSVQLTYSAAYEVFRKNNIWYNELGCTFKLPKI